MRKPRLSSRFRDFLQRPYTPPPRPVYHKDYCLGTLVGEIIWLTKLQQYADYNIHNLTTPEEQERYEELQDVWNATYNADRSSPDKEKSLRSHSQWFDFMSYQYFLYRKYFPDTVEYCQYVNFEVEDAVEFKKGIDDFLWNTDHCGYNFNLEDMTFNNFNMHYMKITFKLQTEYK